MLSGTTGAFRFPHGKQIFVDGDRTLTTQDLNGVISVDSSAGPVTITLPSALEINAGGSFLILAETGDVNPVTVVLGEPGDTYNEGLVAGFPLSTKNAQLLVLGQATSTVWTYLPGGPSSGGGGGGGPGWFLDATWVDSANVDPGADGSMLNPFPAIQAAIDAAAAAQDALPVGNSGPGFRAQTRQQIIVASGFYDEDLSISRGNTFLEFLAAGPVTLGDGSAGLNFESTTPRSVTWVNDQAQEDADSGAANANRRPQLCFGVFPQMGEMSSTQTAIASGWDITGDLILTNAGAATTAELHLQNVKIRGTLDGSGDSGGRNCYFYRCLFAGAVTGVTVGGLLLQVCESCEFDGPTSVGAYGRLVHCEIDGGFTVAAFSPDLPPGGMFGCDFAGTFTGPAGSLQLDAATNFFFVGNSASLGGAATKVLMHDLTP